MDFDPSLFDSDNIPKHELILDINESSLQLITALRIQRESDLERTILKINVNDPQFTTPAFITRSIDAESRLRELVVDTEVNRLTNQSETHVRADIEGSEDVFLSIVVSGAYGAEPVSSMIVGDAEVPCLDPVTQSELNRFLVSLFVKNKLGDYSAFDEMDLSDTAITQRLAEALKEVATEVIVDETYFLDKIVSLNANSIRYTEHDGTIHSATVCMEHHARASEVEIGYTRSPMPMELDETLDNPEYLMQRLEGVRTFTQDVNGEAKQIDSNNDFLIGVRDFLQARRDSVFTKPEELLGNTDIEDPTLTMNIEDRHSDD